jgi:hypothetical protein
MVRKYSGRKRRVNARLLEQPAAQQPNKVPNPLSGERRFQNPIQYRLDIGGPSRVKLGTGCWSFNSLKSQDNPRGDLTASASPSRLKLSTCEVEKGDRWLSRHLRLRVTH